MSVRMRPRGSSPCTPPAFTGYIPVATVNSVRRGGFEGSPGNGADHGHHAVPHRWVPGVGRSGPERDRRTGRVDVLPPAGMGQTQLLRGGAAILVDAQEGGIPPCGRSGIDLWNDMDGFHSFSATRNFADRARGFSRTSVSEGVIGLRVTTRTERWCPQMQTGAWGGQIQSFASTLKRFFAILSSREWKETTPTRPPLASTSMAAFNPFSIASSSRLTAIRKAIKVRVAT